MAPLTLETAYRALKRGDLAPVYYLTGTQDILKDELIDAIVSSGIDQAARDFNLDRRSAGDVESEALLALVDTPPMLAERRAVILRNLEQWRSNATVWKVLLKYLERPNPTTILVLVHGGDEKPHAGLVAAARHVHLDMLPADLARRWTAGRATRAGLTIDPDAADHLLAAVGADLAQVATELDKLAAAHGPERPLTVADVGRLVGIRRGETVSDWVDAVLRRDTARAVHLLEVVLPQSGVTGVRLVMALGTALIGVRLARALRDGGATAPAAERAVEQHIRQRRPQGLGIWRDEARRWVLAAGGWSAAQLEEALRDAYEADRLLKASGVSDERGVLTTLVLRLAPRRAAA